jgi:hypothetical protein
MVLSIMRVVYLDTVEVVYIKVFLVEVVEVLKVFLLMVLFMKMFNGSRDVQVTLEVRSMGFATFILGVTLLRAILVSDSRWLLISTKI